MNDTELVALALRRRDEHVRAYLAVSRTDRGRTTTLAMFLFVVAVTGVFLF